MKDPKHEDQTAVECRYPGNVGQWHRWGFAAMKSRMARVWQSLVGIPRWVQAWLVVLAATNAASLVFLDTAAGRLTAAAFAAVAAVNLPMVYFQAGLTRLLSFTHLVWLPLVFVLLSQLLAPGAAQIDTATRGFMVAVVAVNSISLLFDFIEMWRWSRGEREVLGR